MTKASCAFQSIDILLSDPSRSQEYCEPVVRYHAVIPAQERDAEKTPSTTSGAIIPSFPRKPVSTR
jgi:hypothetical protein